MPPPRVVTALATAMLALGVAAGAAIGPAPSASLAGERLPQLLPSILALAAGRSQERASTTVQPPPATPQTPPPVTPQATPSVTRAIGGDEAAGGATRTPKSKTLTPVVVSPTSGTSPSAPSNNPVKRSGRESAKQAPLPPVTKVWLITLSGATFAQALSQPTAAPYTDSQLVPAGTLLSGWSSLAASAFASEAGLLAGEPPQTLDAIVQPPCPEGAGAPCAPETADALSAADEFLKATVPSIVASAAYREHGLIVITFGTVANATAPSLPAGASTATLGSRPPAGVLLLSPFVRAGARPATAFDPTSPKQSLSALLR